MIDTACASCVMVKAPFDHYGVHMSLICRISSVALGLLVGAPLAAQQVSDCWAEPRPTTSVASLDLRSVRAEPLRGAAPTMDGKLTESVWCAAHPAVDFVQTSPAPGTLATLPSTARVLFDDVAVYVAVRLTDPHPDSIVAPFPRRDDEVNSDWVFVEIDTRFDRRSGFSFGLNPRGVQVDGTWWDDVNYDPAWNGVWQGGATMDAGGWSAEFRIPFSQLALARTGSSAALTWGLNIYRYTPHRGESSNWSPRLPSVVGVVSHFNRLEGIAAPRHATQFELVPYSSVTTVQAPARIPDGMSHRVGGDVRVRPTLSTTALLSVHPDFGQVEADPSQVNLTTFETFLPERRPVFVEGADVFQFPAALAYSSRGTSFAEESPFYSRRVGRPPQSELPDGLRADDQSLATTVLAAGRFSARSSSGWSGGAFHAWTDAERRTGTDSAGQRRSLQVEPLTSYSAGRLGRESSDGDAAVGLMLTAVNRLNPSPRVDSQVPRQAIVVGTDARRRSRHHELTAFVLGSRVTGTAPAIAGLRAQPRHGYGRADLGDSSPNDTSHRALAGLAAQARVARIAGDLQWNLAGRIVTQGFEANDAGFQRNANWMLLAGGWKYQRYRASSWLRRWSVSSPRIGVGWTTDGDLRSGVGTVSLTGDLRSYWGGAVTAGRELPVFDPEVLRGGPAFLVPTRDQVGIRVYSDTRRAWQLTLALDGEREATSDSRRASLSPGLSAFVTDRLQVGVTPRIAWVREGWQYVGQATSLAGGPTTARRHYVLGQLNQREVSLTTRATQAFSSHLTLQWYAQAFLSSGQFAGFSEVISPRARRPSDRVARIATARLEREPSSSTFRLDSGSDSAAVFADPAFANRSLNVNVVLRWEFLPGSTAFLVWTQERGDPVAAPFRFGDDVRRLTRASPTNALQLKLSYWIAP
jgi:Domain of unknown function (DUF5916)